MSAGLTPLDQHLYPLTIVEDLGMLFPSLTSKQKKRFAIFTCPFCGKDFKSETTSVKKGRATKCKSCSIKVSKTTHGESKSKLHNTWIALRDRCNNPNFGGFKNYGGRGISVCKEWDDYLSFKNWSLSNGYSPDLSIDRIDPSGNYCPDNCRWTTRTVQARNTRLIHSTNTTGYRGVYPNKNRFIASIGLNNKSYRLGSFTTKEEAAFAYDEFVRSNNLEHTINGVTL